jgi:hypothetical protein
MRAARSASVDGGVLAESVRFGSVINREVVLECRSDYEAKASIRQ